MLRKQQEKDGDIGRDHHHRMISSSGIMSEEIEEDQDFDDTGIVQFVLGYVCVQLYV